MADARAPQPERLDDLAAAVADRTPIDWDSETERTPDATPALARLREIAALEAAHAELRAAPPEPPCLFRWGALEVHEKLGEGSFGEVFLARDPALDREVALKLRRADPDPRAAGTARWLDEARRLARVRHPNVLLVHGADVHDGRAGLWTERIRGNTLEERLASQGTFGPRETVGVLLDLCGALAAVHAAGLVHGDVTTRNVMREGAAGSAAGTGRIVLMDFGSAHERDEAGLVAFGTPLFTAPEVLQGEAPAPVSDVYALGVVGFRLLTGRWPVEGESLTEIRQRLAAGTRRSLRDLRPELEPELVRTIERACSVHPAQRFASVAEFERALSPLAGAIPARSAKRGVPTWAWAAAAVVVLAAAAALFRSRPEPTPAPAGTPAAAEAPRAAEVSTRTGAPAGVEVADAAVPDVQSRLVRIDADVRSSLESGDLVAPGDRLGLELRASEPLHAYVLSEDERGAVFVLFPLRGRGAANPLRARVTHRLPGGERDPDLAWQVTSAGGREHFLLLASRTPLAPVQQAVASMPEASASADVQYPALTAAAMSKLRGIGGVVHEPATPAGARRSVLADLARDLARSAEGRAIWMRTIVLENPAP